MLPVRNDFVPLGSLREYRPDLLETYILLQLDSSKYTALEAQLDVAIVYAVS
jgi:hypothetical protein